MRKYPDSRILMMNMRYVDYDDDNNNNDELLGDVFLVGDDDEEVSRIHRRLRGFNGIGSYAGENIIMASLGLNSLR